MAGPGDSDLHHELVNILTFFPHKLFTVDINVIWTKKGHGWLLFKLWDSVSCFLKLFVRKSILTNVVFSDPTLFRNLII